MNRFSLRGVTTGGLWRKCLTITSLLFYALASTAQPLAAPESQLSQQFSLQLLGHSPHASDHFTQGLFFHRGHLYESIGQYGQSALIKYAPDQKTPGVRRELADDQFAEGATFHQGKIYQLTWRAGIAHAYQGAMLSPVEGFGYSGEGWGLTSDGDHLWLSNGTDVLQVLDTDGQRVREIHVRQNDRALDRLNELEWIDGWILANRWYDQQIYVIDPISGYVAHSFNLSDLVTTEMRGRRHNVLNGIAWNPDTGELWVTGKNWRHFYQFKLSLPQAKTID